MQTKVRKEKSTRVSHPGRGRRILIGLISGLFVLAVLFTAFGAYTARRSFPQVSGDLHLTGLDGSVDIYRDAMGIPNIYADNTHDLFFAQGYVHAQERFWQMDFWRHIGSGRLSEMFGDSQVETDFFLRTLGWKQIADEEVLSALPEDKALLQAYADGVNAYLNQHSGAAISLEYAILGLLTPGYTPEPWTSANTLTWGKAMAWDLRGNMSAEIERAVLLQTLSPELVAQLFPSYPQDHPVIVDALSPNSRPPITQTQAAGPVVLIDYASIQQAFARVDGVIGRAGSGVGSNSWVLSGALTSTGMPLLANDPHLSIQMPSIWFQVGLHCRSKSLECPFDVTGFSFAGVPGVIIGHNDHIAWGFTNNGPDVMDLYIEKINPNNSNQYEYNGQWMDMDVHTETIQVAGGDSVDLTVRTTRHGPIISDTYGDLKDLNQVSGVDMPKHYAISLAWTALQPSHIFEAVWGFDQAQNFNEFRQAAQNFTVPAQNLVYADVDGNIGYQEPGLIPIRKNGNGTLPVPGWTDEYDWMGFIPFDQLPFAYNPPAGYIVTANNQSTPRDYPYLVSTDWDYGFRAQEIVDMIRNSPGKIDIAYIQKMQNDSRSLNAQDLVPVLMQAPITDQTLSDLRNHFFSNWDYRETAASQSALIFERFWSYLLKDTFNDQLPEDYQPTGGSRWYEIVRELINNPSSSWWDDISTTDRVETRDDIFARAWQDAINEAEKESGKNPDAWPAWGDVHTSTFQNQTLGKSGVAPIEALFNRGPFATGGGESIVNATGWIMFETYAVDWLPSMRMIVDLGDLTNSVTVHTTGESGHAYAPHYIDLAPLWASGQYYPMLWNEQIIVTSAEAHLRLLP